MAGENAPATARKSEARFIGDVPGCFVFLDRAGPQWDGQVFAFSARSITTARAALSTGALSLKGERVALRFDSIGIRRGVVERVLKEGFIVSFTEEGGGDTSVDARIDWLKQKSRGRAEDKRAHKRVLPRDPAARLILGADRTVDCRIRDMSRSGAAIAAAEQPPIGQLVAIGSVPGRVVRHFEGGFGMQFLELQDLTTLESMLTLRTRHERSAAARKLGFAA